MLQKGLLALVVAFLAVGPVPAEEAILRRIGSDCMLLLNEQPMLHFALPRMMGMPPETFEATTVSDGWTHVTLGWHPRSTVLQDDLHVDFALDLEPTLWWAPHLAPTSNDCIAQHVFRSPALIAANGTHAVAVIPDLTLVGKSEDTPWYLDVDAPAKRWALGISKSIVVDHVRFERLGGARFEPGDVKIGFYLNAYALEGPAADPFAKVSAFHWNTNARPLLAQANAPDAPATAPLDRYVEHTYAWAFDRWKDTVWQEFDFQGKHMGAPAFIVNVTQSPNYEGEENLREFLSIWNQAWFSSLRSASGLLRYAERTQNADLRRRAMLTKELALAAPRKGSLFYTVLGTQMEQVPVNGELLNRSKGWETALWQNSNRVPWNLGVTDVWFHLLDQSWTALQMLQWYDELEKDNRLIDFAQTYADAILPLQDESGFFPAWIRPSTMEASPVLRVSSENSMSAWLLLELAAKDRYHRRAYRKAALKAVDAVVREIVVPGRWEDFETYWSCNGYGKDDLLGKREVRSGMFKQNNFGMYWTAAALLAAHEATKGDTAYLAWGQRVMHELSLTQQVWQPPFIEVPALGGFGVMNFDGEWNDARQSLYAELFLDYYRATGESAYFERGVAALRASFVMMYCPENPTVKAAWERTWPFFGPEDYGFTMENYAHGGSARAQDNPMGEFTIYDWGNGAAAEARNRIRDHFGDVYIDIARGQGFGIDGIAVEKADAGYRLRDRAGTARDVLVVFSDGRRQSLRLDGETMLAPAAR